MKKIASMLGAFCFIASTTTPVWAADDEYTYCSIAGYLQGENSEFMADLARTMMMHKTNGTNNRACSALYQSAVRVGKKLASGNSLSPDEWEIANEAGRFKNRIEESILRSAGY